jgi:hypothetical protein
MKDIFKNYDFYFGRMISGSKSGYREKYPDNEIYFNANIFVLGEGKVWWGDLDLTLDEKNLKCVARDLGKDLFILREMDGRFENENLKDSEIISRSVCKISK